MRYLYNNLWHEVDSLKSLVNFLLRKPPIDLLPERIFPEGIVLEDGTTLTEELAKIKYFEFRVEDHMNSAARSKGYDNIRSAALRAGYEGPYKQEGINFAQWMDACWVKCYEILDDYQNNRIPEPTLEEILNMLPILSFNTTGSPLDGSPLS